MVYFYIVLIVNKGAYSQAPGLSRGPCLSYSFMVLIKLITIRYIKMFTYIVLIDIVLYHVVAADFDACVNKFYYV